MNNFYTNVTCYGNNILYRGIENEKKVKLKIQYSPTLYIPSKKNSEYLTLQGEKLEPIKFENIREARNFVKKYDDVSNFSIYGITRYEYSFIMEKFSGEINWKVDDVVVAYIDIEVGSESGFPEPSTAKEPITAITVKFSNNSTYYVFGCGDYTPHLENIKYIHCKYETELAEKFISFWQDNCPDVITGWNVKGFDIPYLVNRISKLLSEKDAKKLSPWELISEREETFYGRTQKMYDIIGIPTLDYFQLFRKYAPNYSQESYRLNHIAQVEKVGEKVDYADYNSLHSLYKENFQKFIEYNVRDVELVEKLNAKGRLIDMALTLAYDNKVNYDDVFSQVRMWDIITCNHLHEQKIIVPPKKESSKNATYEGAYVKDPQIGKHDWVASFDLNSLYPHLIMQYNLSPETLIEPKNYDSFMVEILSQGVNVDKLLKKQIKIDECDLTNATLTPNGHFFRTDVLGFLPAIMKKMYDDRVVYKNSMLEAQKNYEKEKNSQKKIEYAHQISRYKNLQLAKKVGLNSAYGAMGNQYFRFFDVRIAEGITLAGQLSIRWIENKINEYMNKMLKTNKDYVIASDTDSIYLDLSSLVNSVFKTTENTSNIISFMNKVCEEKIQPFIDSSYQELADYVHAHSQKMQMKREILADKAIWVAKKRYILNVHNSEGVQFEEPQIKIQGLEAIKSSTPSACREKIKKALNIILQGTESELHEYIENFKNEFKSILVEEISFPRSVNGLKTYKDDKNIWSKGTPIHVRGALMYNHMIDQMNLSRFYPKIQEGEKIKFIYLKEPNIFKTNVISFVGRVPEEFEIEGKIDYNLQFEKSFIDPLSIILNTIDWKTEKISSLESFFS